MTIHIEAEEWSMTAGLIGLARVLGEDKVSLTKNGVTLKPGALDGLSEKYIYKLINSFSVVNRDVKRMEWYVNQLKKNPEKTKQYASDVRKMMNEQLKKIEKYFSETEEYKILHENVDRLKDVKEQGDFSLVEESVRIYQNVVSTPFINDKLTLNYAKAVILNPFFGQTSILQPTFNAKNTYEHVEKIREDFVWPATLELQFAECLENATDYEQIFTFLEEHQEVYKPFKDWLREVKKLKTLKEVQNYFQEDVLPCSFVDGLLATQSYEEMVFSPLALSRSKAVNFNWEFEKKQPVPLSAVARLVMFMAPLGLAFYTRKRGSAQSNETLRFAGLILSQQRFSTMINENNHYQQLRSGGSTFEEAIVGVLQESLDKAEKIKNSYLFLEVHSDYQSKKTLLDYYHMPAYLTAYLAKNGKTLTLLHHRDLRDTFLRTVLKGIDPKQVVFEYLREAVTNGYHGTGAYHATRERKRILDSKKGVEEMGKNDKLITFIYYRGVELREQMIRVRSGDEENAPYRASGRKKLEGIAYRLINATKSGDKVAFMDTVFRMYMGTKLEVPSVFIDSFKEEGLDFETIASAFIAGMLGQEKTNKEEVVNNG